MVGDGLGCADSLLKLIDGDLDADGEFHLGDLGVVHSAGVDDAHAPDDVADGDSEASLVGVVLHADGVVGAGELQHGLDLVEVESDLGLVGLVADEGILVDDDLHHGDVGGVHGLHADGVGIDGDLGLVDQGGDDVDQTLEGVCLEFCFEHLDHLLQLTLQLWLHLQQR